MKRSTTVAAVTLSALVLAGGVGVGIAAADPTPTPSASPSASASATPTTGARARQHRGLAARALHGEVTLAGKKHQVVDFQRGTVAEVSSTSVTVTSEDGFSATYAVSGDTRVRRLKEDARIDDVKTGDRVRVTAVKHGSVLDARRIGDAGPT